MDVPAKVKHLTSELAPAARLWLRQHGRRSHPTGAHGGALTPLLHPHAQADGNSRDRELSSFSLITVTPDRNETNALMRRL